MILSPSQGFPARQNQPRKICSHKRDIWRLQVTKDVVRFVKFVDHRLNLDIGALGSSAGLEGFPVRPIDIAHDDREIVVCVQKVGGA